MRQMQILDDGVHLGNGCGIECREVGGGGDFEEMEKRKYVHLRVNVDMGVAGKVVGISRGSEVLSTPGRRIRTSSSPREASNEDTEGTNACTDTSHLNPGSCRPTIQPFSPWGHAE
jgi:hypothetical protein